MAQVFGAVLAALLLRASFGDVANLGATQPGTEFSPGQAFLIEVVLTLGLVSTILGTASLRGPGGGPHGIRAAQGNLPDTAPG